MKRRTVRVSILYSRIGQAIRDRRAVSGLSIHQLSAMIDTTSSHIQRVETGETTCSVPMLVDIADVFDCTLDDLVPVMTDGELECS